MADITTLFIQIIILILGIVGFYYLYQYLFSGEQPSVVLSSGMRPANPQTVPVPIRSDVMPPLYQGGEFSVSTWIYVNNWSVNQNKNKSILRIGGSTFDTLRIYLGASQPQVMVRLDDGTQKMKPSDKTFTDLQTGANLQNSFTICDTPPIDLQRWVNLVVVVNGMTCDVYVDGKLIRSCVLPNYFTVDTNYSVRMLEDGTGNAGGFGGSISTTTMYGYALAPDAIYTNYIQGPNAISSLFDYLVSFFKPSP